MADAQRKNSNKAYIEVGGDPAVDLLNRRLKYAENRHRLAGIVQQELEWEIKNNLENSILNLHYDDSGLLDHHSAAEWVKNKYDVYRFDYEELKFISEAKPQGNYKANAISFANQGFSGIQAKRYLIIMAYLIEKLAQLDDKYRTANKVNVSAIAEMVCDAFYSDTDTDTTNKGYDQRTVRDRLNIALEMKKQFLKINP
jgi:hypothetical protein